MRDYGRVSPRFWIGETGRKIRSAGADAQVIALYLLTCPNSNMIGLYYLPLATLAHETGIPLQGASKALQRLSEADFARFDPVSEVVWIPEMARHQVGHALNAQDLRVKGVVREAEQYRKCPFFADFYDRYRAPFNLPDPGPLARPLEAPSKPLRSQEQEQEQEQEKTISRTRGAQEPDPEFDFDAIYAAYPRKLGKTRGLKTCKAQVRTAADYDALRRAVDRYAAECRGKDPEFVKHFSTFMSCWRDYATPADDRPDDTARAAQAILDDNRVREERAAQRRLELLAGGFIRTSDDEVRHAIHEMFPHVPSPAEEAARRAAAGEGEPE